MTNLLLGDCLEQLKNLPDNSIDSIVTDPPYGLAFMGKKWDYDVPSTQLWSEAFRVLKPGGHLLSFGGTRTYHRMVVNIEDAGFEIRDQIMWLYGSGFPKSHDISKAIDKAAGAEREVVGKFQYRPNDYEQDSTVTMKVKSGGIGDKQTFDITKPSTPEAIQWQGWGTALKPANEPIVVARKPLEKGLTVAQNVLKWGTGALNIDGSRIEAADQAALAKNWDRAKITDMRGGNYGNGEAAGLTNSYQAPQGRWPANVILDEEAAKALDEQTEGQLHSAGKAREKVVSSEYSATSYHAPKQRQMNRFDDGSNIGASRFFYCAKASKSERNAGLEGIVKEKQGARPNSKDASGKFPDHDHRPSGGNNHPTVKPIKLMSYLINLVTPPQGVVLDPFMGSGTTGVAAVMGGFTFFGIEREPDYMAIAEKRIENASA